VPLKCLIILALARMKNEAVSRPALPRDAVLASFRLVGYSLQMARRYNPAAQTQRVLAVTRA